ncbi:AMP nucleosidase [Escherichia coli]|nr:AMP nucleosidase [Escherichia coli]TNK22799.1 AMP nucleosidase [Escherichia coli]
MLPSETMIWQPEFTDKTLSRKTGAVHLLVACSRANPSGWQQGCVLVRLVTQV